MNLKNLFNKTKFFPFHVLFWIVVWLFYRYFFGFNSNNQDYIVWFSNFLIPITIVNTYFTVYYLIPNYLITKKYGLFILYSIYTLIISAYLISFAMLFGYVFLSESDFNKMPLLSRSMPFILMSMYLVIIIVSAFKLVIYTYKSLEKNKNLETKFLQTQLQLKEEELKHLKMQIHPHFLFNTLNTLYGLALKKSEEAPEMILKLSNLLDYILYQINKPKVLLSEEVEHIKEYIELEKTRFQESLKVTFNSEKDFKNIEIAPMLLIPFVENAFKHGRLINGYLNIVINIQLQENTLQFSIKNTILEENKPSKQKGIGLKNIKKRLQLVYPNTHQLVINQDINWYNVHLLISNLNTLNNE